ncbi:MAG: hypothetical protein JOY86_02325 [Candidatus Eremiobacteraeota bacterium]|nr:hypothetical protein [Candidatus Eremiobacteraeota bacterium]
MPAIAALALVGAKPSSAPSPSPIVITLVSESNARIHGTATLTPMGEKTKVVVALVNDPAGAFHPAHIHQGECGGEFDVLPRYPLNPVVGGRSVTTVAAPIHDIIGHGFVIEVHASKYHVDVIAACGTLGG